MPAGTNATVAIAGDTLLTAASFPQSADQKATIIAYRLGATGGEGTGTDTGETTGADTGETTGTDTGADTTATEPGSSDTTAAADGASVFTGTCGACHTLAAAGTSGSVGPNLDQIDLDQQAIADKVRNGGGGMPAFEGRLSDAEIEAVAQYVAENRGAEGGENTEPGGSP
jgi:cytochrome c553